MGLAQAVDATRTVYKRAAQQECWHVPAPLNRGACLRGSMAAKRMRGLCAHGANLGLLSGWGFWCPRSQEKWNMRLWTAQTGPDLKLCEAVRWQLVLLQLGCSCHEAGGPSHRRQFNSLTTQTKANSGSHTFDHALVTRVQRLGVKRV